MNSGRLLNIGIIISIFWVFGCSDSPDSPNSQTPGGSNPDYSIIVDGQSNCIILDNTIAAKADIPGGSYQVSMSGNAYYSPSASHGKVLVRYGTEGKDVIEAWSIGSSPNVIIRNDSYKFFAFFADWTNGGTNDNSGVLNITLGNNTIAVDGKNNCITLDNTVAKKASIPGGTYTVKIAGDARYSSTASHGNVFVRYGTIGQDVLDSWAIGSSQTVTIRNDSYAFFAFFADWTVNGTYDNQGQIKLEFYKQ